ncbi:sterol desaturase family protein [Pseudophaeobacter sp.]|uniref:sterol desaturase family protein n=1 Tax=Pseudophaeobacter sp. TaxID=1971739 RepID=UPI0040583767
MISKTISQLFLLYLTTLMGAIYYFTLGNSMQEAYLTIASLVVIGLSLAMERLFPLHREWNVSKGDAAGDIGSFVVVFGLIDSALKWLSPFIILALLPDIGMASSWPLWAQIAIAMLMIEFAAWVSHWAHHKFKPLWALHAMHHSTERLYTMNNFRFHPLNHILNYLIMFLPLLALGISAEAILGYTALTLPVLLLQHSNVGFNFGFLSWLLNTNTLHRWHHSSAYKEGMHNFGRALVVWDHLFGTYHNPADHEEPKSIGLASAGLPYPRSNSTLKQILWPFSKECCQ